MNLKQFISFLKNTTAILLIAAILYPSLLKLSHHFNHSEHYVCDETQTTHFHSLDLDCEFYKFKISKVYYFKNAKFLDLIQQINTTLNYSYNSTYYNNQQKTQFLRGPPHIS